MPRDPEGSEADGVIVRRLDLIADNNDNFNMSSLALTVRRGKTYLTSVRNLQGTDADLVSGFDFPQGSVCLLDRSAPSSIKVCLENKGVEVRPYDGDVDECYSSLSEGAALLVVTGGAVETRLKPLVYVPYPNPSNVVLVYEQGSMPPESELRNPIMYKKALPSGGRKLYLFDKGKPKEIVKSLKFNTQRAPDFRVNTVITKCAAGLKVVKKAGCPEAGSHIKTILQNYELLSKSYARVIPAPCKEADGSLEVEFIQGEDLLKGTDLVNDPPLKIRDDINAVFDVILDYKDDSLINIDSNLDNFVRCGEKIYCIDYEWAAPRVPLDYVKFRALHFYYRHNAGALGPRMSREDFLELFGYSPKDIKKFDATEQHFQAYTVGLEREPYKENSDE